MCVCVCVCVYIYIYIYIYIQPEDGSKKQKRVDERCKFTKYYLKNCVRLYCIILYN